ncbi:MAG: glycosyltransferase family 4 protein [Gammaproteobacteria bacterium]|nr:glycosyltransferase family 4 protein [Gammaproteobacteria bacterium]
MHIIFLNRFFHPDLSATSQMLSDLAFSLAKAGKRVDVIASRQRYDVPNALLPRQETLRGVRIHRIWTSRFGRAWLPGRMFDYLTFYTSAAWCLWRLANADSVIVAKTDPPLISVMAAGIARLRRAPLVNWLQDLFPEIASALRVRSMNGILARCLRGLRNASLRQAAMNVAVGERMATYLTGQRIPAARIAVIHNWADADAVQPLPAAANPLRATWGLSDRFVVGYSGNLGRAHDFGAVLQAAELLREQTRIVFLIIGDGYYKTWLEREAVRRRLENLAFKPYQPRERLAQSLGAADVHLISLRPELEGFIVPSKFYGIAAAGRPMVFMGDAEGEIARLLAQEHGGSTVAPDNGRQLAKIIGELANNPDLGRQWGANARQALERHFSGQQALAAWRALLEGVASH